MLRSKQLDLKKLLKNFDKKGLAPKIKKDYDVSTISLFICLFLDVFVYYST